MPPDRYEIKAPARLHFGFMDLHGGMGRRFGSIGMALSSPQIHLQATASPHLEVTGEGHEKAQTITEILCRQANANVAIEIKQTISEHQGLGSGTQMALAIGHAIANIHNTGWNSIDIARLSNRGQRSGIGIGAFDRGGFLVDGGKSKDEGIPLITSCLKVPEEWRVILITNTNHDKGLYGAQEKMAFKQLPEFAEKCAAYLSRLVIMGMMPAVMENNFDAFATALTRFQDRIGDYFSAFQEERYASVPLRKILEFLRQRGIQGIGQSSWGPTGFVFRPNQKTAEDLVTQIQAEFSSEFTVKLSIVQANNSGAHIKTSNKP